MRIPIPALAVCLGISALSCSHAPDPTTSSAPDTAAAAFSTPVLTSALLDATTGAGHEALGVYTLERDPSNPLVASLSMARQLTAQGDLYELSVRPFMTPDTLRIVGTTQLAGATDYQLEFHHPIPMPVDLERPASATKRIDLFLFDVQTLLVLPGTERFFDGALKTNTTAMPNADGYRELAPLADLASLGISDGTNLFPYKLLYNTVASGPPSGNYSLQNAWTGSDVLNANGYDVIPQGGSATTTIRLTDGVPGPVHVVVVAKYQDPRQGTTLEEKRINRLPHYAHPWTCRYFLPEACGDNQIITPTINTPVRADSRDSIATVTARILDWDHASAVATAFPNQANPSEIRQASTPAHIAASVPALQATGTFDGTLGAGSGLINEYVDVAIPVHNTDLSLPVGPEGRDVTGLIRIEDSQSGSAPTTTLDESLAAITPSPAQRLDSRYQVIGIHVDPAMEAGVVTPQTGKPMHTQRISLPITHGPVTSWDWDFGGGATPNISHEVNPQITMSDIEGAYAASVTVHHLDAEIVVPFTLRVDAGTPVIPAELDNYAHQPLPRHYTDPTYPFGAIATSDNTPADNPVTDAGATLGRALFYDIRLSKNFTVSCASCHLQSRGFADNKAFSKGFDGRDTLRNPMALANCRYYLNGRMFSDERAATLEEQVLMPIQDSIEMGNTLPVVTGRLANTAFYPGMFAAAFGDPEITDARMAKALAQFIRSMVSYRSKYDTAMEAGPNGTPDFPAVFTPQELKGLGLFQGFPGQGVVNMACNQCHSTAAMTLGAAADPPLKPEEGPFSVNNGLSGWGTEANLEFKPASLRNIELTGPYMFDGRFTTLEQVVDFYSLGVANGPALHRFLRAGDNPTAPPERFGISIAERDALVAFLKTLTDNAFLTDPKFSDPFGGP